MKIVFEEEKGRNVERFSDDGEGYEVKMEMK
jgi:hypothetical protein